MNIKQLETFYWAAKLGSFTAAAERVTATQSTVSMRILDLERTFGVALFDRSQRRARLTRKGRELMSYAENMLNMTAEIQKRISAPDSMPGFVRLGVVEVVSITWLPKFIKTVHQRYPKVVLELDEALTVDLVARLRSGSLDLVLAPGRTPGYNFITRSLGTMVFAWMASPALGIGERPLGPRDLQQWPVIALARESYHHATIEDWFRAGNAYCRRIDTCKSLGVAASLTAAGLGVSYLPIRCYEKELSDGRLQILQTKPSMPPVEFTATMSVDGFYPIAQLMSELAVETSDFDKVPSEEESAKQGRIASQPIPAQ